MAGAKRLPKEVVAKAREAAEQSAARAAAKPTTARAAASHSDLRPPTSDLKVRAKVLAHLRRLHPMD